MTPQYSDKYSHPGPVIKCSGSNAPDISKCGDRPEGITLSAKAIEYLLITRLETVNQQYHSAWLRYGATTTKTTKRGNNKKKYKYLGNTYKLFTFLFFKKKSTSKLVGITYIVV